MSDGYLFAPESIVQALGPAPAVFYGRILRYCMENGGQCCVRLSSLSSECNVSQGTAKRWTKQLSDAGYIVHESGKAKGSTGTITTTGKFVPGRAAAFGGVAQDGLGVGQNELGVGQNELPPPGGLSVLENDVKAFDVKGLKSKSLAREDRPPTMPALRRRGSEVMAKAFRETFPGAAKSKVQAFAETCDELGLTVDRWHAFLVSPKAAQDLSDGYLTPGNAIIRFKAWAGSHRVSNRAAAAPAPDGAPPNWRELVYAPGGIVKAASLILPKLGIDPYAPREEWPAWLAQAVPS